MIVVDKVSKYYGAKRAVSDLSFQIGRGECIGFLGLNGAGKTTTLRLLSCLLLPTSGRVTVHGLDVVEHPHEIRRLIGYLPDQPPVYPEMTVQAFLAFAGRLRGLSGADLDARCRRVLGQCGLAGVRHHAIGTLSHGYRQRVGIAQAIVHAPALLILDEPIQGLDPVQIVQMRAMIGELRGEHTILLSTHILSEIERTCDRILMMHEGRIRAEGTEEELAARLSRGRRLRMLVRGEEAALRRALAPFTIGDGGGDLALEPAGDGTLRVSLRVDDAARERVSRAVVQADLGLLDMQTVSTGLESVFLELSRAPASLPPAAPAEAPASTGGAA